VAQTTANADAVLKNYYLGPIREQLNQKAVLMFNSDTVGEGSSKSPSTDGERSWRGLSRESENIEYAGRQWVIPAHTARNEGMGAIAEGGTIPVAGQQGWTDLQDTLKHNLGAIEITRFAIRLSERSEGAFLRLLKGETEGMVKDLRKDVNRQGYGNGTGTLCAVTADGAQAFTADSIQYLRVGMRIDAVDVNDDSVDMVNRTILTINEATKVVGYSGVDAALAANHRICRTGSWKKEINGLGKLIDNVGNVHGVDSTLPANMWFKSVVKVAAGAAFSEDVGQQVLDAIDMTGQGDNEIIITTHGIVRRYANQLKAMKRFNDAQSVKLRGGFTALLFNEQPMFKDVECPKGTMYFLDTDGLAWIYLPDGDQPGNWDWVDDDGAILTRKGDRSDAFEAYIAADHDMAVLARNSQGKITGLEDDAAGVWS